MEAGIKFRKFKEKASSILEVGWLGEDIVLLTIQRVPRKRNMYSVDLKNIVPKGGLTCLFTKATSDKSKLWHRRLRHLNFKTMNKLVKGNLVRGKFSGKADEGFFVGYFLNSKAFRVFNSRKMIVEENLHIRFSESTPNVVGSGPNRLFDIDALTRTMNYKPIVADTQSIDFASTRSNDFADPKTSHDDGFKPSSDDGKKVNEDPSKESICKDLEKEDNVNNTNNVNVAGPIEVNVVVGKTSIKLPNDPNMPTLEDEELLQFMLQEVRTLVDLPNGKRAIGTKWGFRNKTDERGIMIRNKAILVTQGYTQEEEIDYDEVFASVARIKAIRLFLAYASFKDFMVYQMDVKSVFLYEKTKEEVYVCQPPRFEDPDFSDRVYKLEKALYGLHQAPRAWYETLSTYLLDNGFQRGKIDNTLFIISHKDDILLIQVYVDDIIFGSTKKELCIAFKKLMFTEVKNASTPMETQPLLKDEDGEEVDVHMYRSMIGPLMYLTSSRPDIMFAVCVCARYQVNLKVSHLHAMKRIFRVDGKEINITESSVRRDLRLADEEGVDCLPNSTIFENLKLMSILVQNPMGEGSAIPTDPQHTPIILQPSSSQPQKTQKPKKPKRKNTQVPQSSGSTKIFVDEAVYKELDDILVRAASIASSLEVEQDSEKTKTTQALEITSLKRRVKKLEKSKGQELISLKDYIRDLHGEDVFVEKEVANKKVNDEIQKVVEEVEDNNTAKLIVDAAQVSVAGEVNADSIATTVSAAATITTKEINLAQVHVEIKTSKPKAKGSVLQEPSESITTTTTISSNKSQDKERLEREKAQKEQEANIALIEEWDDVQVKIDADYQLARRLQTEEQEELTDAEKAILFLQLLKKAGEELTQESAKKQKVEDDKETTKLKQLMKIIPDEEDVAIDAIPLAVKPPGIVDWKIYKEEMKSYYQIIRADGKSKMYMLFSQMLQSFDKEDLGSNMEDATRIRSFRMEAT
uniref:Retrovirus-related Pol polyprotein from transposon TNT 1-94 n=1 Tax=Tanacetum cinerariifolium TaxID=118510 RepID=A0A6L2N756_TANCI|nr:retrovirus-related Pol polyprotein from transposon TNT 1-94 [Tanacetum cinerariifolium]